ncbi:MAG: deoxynucleoside kinase, partial [Aestuariivirga sp.]
PRVAEPDLVIWLQAEPDVLLARIRARGRPMEQGGVSEDYLQRLGEAYRQFFTGYRGAPVLAVNVEAFHPAERPADWHRLLDAIDTFEGPFDYLDPADDAVGTAARAFGRI